MYQILGFKGGKEVNYYIDIKLISDAEMPINRLLNMLYTKLHRALYDLSSENIGVSFPSYSVLLGNRLRIHSDKEELEKLQKMNWVDGLSGYCQIADIQAIPNNCQFRIVSRIQPSMSQSKLRRLVKRDSITEEEAKSYKAKMFSKGLNSPYLELESSSNGHKHRRYIQFGELLDTPIEGTFDTFGLSRTATIPWF
jgi:CRISPR-associated endonuclease Csy4